MYLHAKTNPSTKKGGRHPNPRNSGKPILPVNEPIRPNIIVSDTVIVLKINKYFIYN